MDVNVSKLLQQLEELKQKKARNVKKLKKKLGRATVLKQSDSNVEHVKHESNEPEISISFKTETFETRNILGELNSKSNSSCNIQPSGNELCLEEMKNCSDNHATTCSDFKSHNLIHAPKTEISTQLIVSENSTAQEEVTANKDISSLQEDSKILDVSESLNETSRNKERTRGQGSRKRSAHELHNEEVSKNYIGVNKKSKTSDKDFSEKNVPDIKVACQRPNFELPENNYDGSSELWSHSHKKLNDEKREIIENDSECLFSSQLDRNKSNLMRFLPSRWESSQSTEEAIDQSLKKVEGQHINAFNVCNVLNNQFVLNNFNSDTHFDSMERKNSQVINSAKYSQDQFRNFDVKEDSCSLVESKDSKEILNENLDGQVAVNNVCVLGTSTDKHFLESHSKDEPEYDLDLNVTEVADTEVIATTKSASSVVDNGSKLISNSPSKISFDKLSTGTNFDNVCLINSQPNVANFEEVITENNEPEMANPALHLTNNRDSFDCGFTDEEDEDEKYIDSGEIRALFKSDSEENEKDEAENYINSDEMEAMFKRNSADNEEDCFANSELEEDIADDIIDAKSEMRFRQKKDVFDYETYCDNTEVLQENDQCTNVEGLNSHALESSVLVVPETELFDYARYNESEVDNVAQNVCITTVNNMEGKGIQLNVINRPSEFNNSNLDIISSADKSDIIRAMNPTRLEFEDSKQKMDTPNDAVVDNELLPETEFDNDPLDTEDFLKLVNYRQIPLNSESIKSNLIGTNETLNNDVSSLKFQCSLRSEIDEMVTNLKVASFNNSLYLFIQHLTWIQVWRQEKSSGWTKIHAHQFEALRIQELCFSQNENYLVLIMLLSSEDKCHCLQFLAFERESRLIKVMEHTHWFENRCESQETVFLCGLDDLKFAAAQGQNTFQVYTHSFSCLESSPRMETVTLGSTTDCIHSLCRIDKLPNALLGMSDDMLYVWHLLEARLVTSVHLQVENSLTIERCISATVENSLVFMMAACKESEGPEICQLLATNLATGCCEVALTYTLHPAKDVSLIPHKKVTLVYSEPIIGATCGNGAYIWSAEDEYCCAALNSSDYTSITIVPTFKDSFLILVGCDGGCVNCYELKF